MSYLSDLRKKLQGTMDLAPKSIDTNLFPSTYEPKQDASLEDLDYFTDLVKKLNGPAEPSIISEQRPQEDDSVSPLSQMSPEQMFDLKDKLESGTVLPKIETQSSAPIVRKPAQILEAPRSVEPLEPKVIDFGKGSESSVANLKALQDKQKNSDDLAFYSKLGNTIGGALSHASPDVIKSNEKLIDEAAQGPTKDLERFHQRVAMEKKDPNSPYSQGLKDYIKKQYGMEIRGDISGEDLEKSGVMKQVADNYEKDKYQKFQEKLQQDRLAEQKEQAALRREEIGAYKDTQRSDRLNRDEEKKKQNSISNKTRFQEKYNDYIKKENEGLQSAGLAKELLDSKNPIADQAIQRQLARLSGEVGVLTDQDVASFGGSKQIGDQIQQFISTRFSGEGLTPGNREYMKQLIEKMEKRRQEDIKKKTMLFAKQGAVRFDISPEDAYGYVRPFEDPPSFDDIPKEEMVNILAPNGKIKKVQKSLVNDALKAGGKLIE